MYVREGRDAGRQAGKRAPDSPNRRSKARNTLKKKQKYKITKKEKRERELIRRESRSPYEL